MIQEMAKVKWVFPIALVTVSTVLVASCSSPNDSGGRDTSAGALGGASASSDGGEAGIGGAGGPLLGASGSGESAAGDAGAAGSNGAMPCVYSEEICDGLDNDCDGIADNEPLVDQACNQQQPGFACRGGACVCAFMCDGQCVDPKADWHNCGACGTTCSLTTPLCVNGACQPQPSCSELAPTCGPNGNADCCASNAVTGGPFDRGNDARYPARVDDFWLDTYEVTVGRFRNFVNVYSKTMIASGSGKNPNNPHDHGWDATWNNSLEAAPEGLTTALKCNTTYQTWSDAATSAAAETLPINCLDWFEAEAFCIWDGGRLPTEAEWNYAAAGGAQQRTYPWGSAAPGSNASLAVYGCNHPGGSGSCTGIANIARVGSIPAGSGFFGQADLAGNVEEWVQDWYVSPYASECNNCSYMTSSSVRVLRGGNFYDDAEFLLTSSRSFNAPSSRFSSFGARCARTH